ncbi:MAG TPA: BON domain-containing protein [Terriglobales bacterium]|nr:BON domain-containing protein [Terriglobales bacterium]
MHAISRGLSRGRGSSLLTRLGLGTAVGLGYYLFDPRLGRQRRAQLREQLTSSARHGTRAAEGLGRDLGNRARGVTARTRSRWHAAPVDDATLVARVRSEMGRWVDAAHAIAVAADQGAVTLSGTVAAPEHRALLRHLRRVRGVDSIDDQLTVIGAGDGQWLPRLHRMQEGWSPTKRLLAAGATALLLQRFGPVGRIASMLGLSAYRRRAGRDIFRQGFAPAALRR